MQGTWTTLAAMPTPRAAFAAVTGLDGRIYAIGGLRHGNREVDLPSTILATVEAYDPATNTWSTMAPMPTPRYNLTAVVVADGSIYTLGGDAYLPGSFGPTTMPTIEIFNPGANQWTTLAPMPAPARFAAAFAAADGQIRLLSWDGTLQTYAPTTSTWTTGPAMLESRGAFGATAAADGTIYVAGGQVSLGTGVDYTHYAEAYLTATNRWHSIADLPTPRLLPALAAARDGRIYALGGGFFGKGLDVATNYLATVEAYTPSADTWSAVASLPTARMALAATTGQDGRLYTLGGWVPTPVPGAPGYASGQVTGVVEMYTPPASCQFVLGFRALHDRVPKQVGDCLDDEQHNPVDGDGVQHTTSGLLVWRKVDNVVAFTNGYHTWLLGPTGLVVRLNTERCPWEANPAGLPVAACGPAG
jgi:hypothetical protein